MSQTQVFSTNRRCMATHQDTWDVFTGSGRVWMRVASGVSTEDVPKWIK